jgi:hypothetical protein
MDSVVSLRNSRAPMTTTVASCHRGSVTTVVHRSSRDVFHVVTPQIATTSRAIGQLSQAGSAASTENRHNGQGRCDDCRSPCPHRIDEDGKCGYGEHESRQYVDPSPASHLKRVLAARSRNTTSSAASANTPTKKVNIALVTSSAPTANVAPIGDTCPVTRSVAGEFMVIRLRSLRSNHPCCQAV